MGIIDQKSARFYLSLWISCALLCASCSDDSSQASSPTDTTDTQSNIQDACADPQCPPNFTWDLNTCSCIIINDTDTSNTSADASDSSSLDTSGDPDTQTPQDTTENTDATDTPNTPDTSDAPDTLPPLPESWPDSPTDYVHGSVSFINTLRIPPIENDTPVCCKDFGAISKDDGIDNAVARLLLNPAIETQLQTNNALAQSIETGNLSILLDHQQLDPLPDDPDGLLLVLLQGRFSPPTTFEDANLGLGTFTINPESFSPNSGQPLTVFNPATLTDNTLSTPTAAYFFKLNLAGATLELPILDAQIYASLSPQSTSSQLTYEPTSWIAGYIESSAFRDAINQFFAAECACLNLPGPLYNNSSTWGPTQCMDRNTAISRCPTPSPNEIACINLADTLVCSALPLLIRTSRDISTDSDPKTFEALSVGLTFSAVPAQTVGITPPTP